MIKNVKIGKKHHKISIDHKDFFEDDYIKQCNSGIVLDMMNDCLDTTYNLVKKTYPYVTKPQIYLSDSEEVNACALGGKDIVIYAGLIFQAAALIETRYTEEVIKKYQLFNDYNSDRKKILSGIRVYLWRYVLLHELYHIWNGHGKWRQQYEFNESGVLVKRTNMLTDLEILTDVESVEAMAVSKISRLLTAREKQSNITQQAIEFDADSSAVCMLVNLLMRNADAMQLQGDRKKNYIKNELGLIMGALATAFCLFDGNAGAKFECLNELEDITHPIPAIRMVYAEEIADCCLNIYYKDTKEMLELQTEWRKVVCDVAADYEGQIDMGQVFYYTAYTRKAQEHICKLKHRLIDMYDTMKPFVLGNYAEKLNEEDAELIEEAIWFDESGKSLRGWINPATGTAYAKRASQTIVKPRKIGRNEMCPCGSGKKYKKCCMGK